MEKPNQGLRELANPHDHAEVKGRPGSPSQVIDGQASGLLVVTGDTMTKAILIKSKISMGLAYIYRDWVHFHQSRKHGSIRTSMVLETKLKPFLMLCLCFKPPAL